jgi:hypothetical protein
LIVKHQTGRKLVTTFICRASPPRAASENPATSSSAKRRKMLFPMANRMGLNIFHPARICKSFALRA